MAGLMFPKPRPAALEREDRRKARKSLDEKESDKVRTRSGGQCEVIVGHRCPRKARHVHHKIFGWGKRARAASADASAKLHVCDQCHREIHAHVLVPDGDRFRRLT